MATGNITTTTHAKWIGEEWSPRVTSATEFEMMLPSLFDRQYETLVRSHGNKVNVPYGSNLTAVTRTLAETADVAVEVFTEDEQELDVGTHKVAAFRVQDVAELQSNYGISEFYTGKIAYALANGMEVTCAALAASFSQSVGTLAVPHTWDDIVAANRLLDERGVPSGQRFCVLSPRGKEDMLKMEQVINRDYAGEQAVRATKEAYIGRLLGVDFYWSNMLTANGSGRDGFFCHKTGNVFILQQPAKIETQRMLINISDIIVGYVVYGTEEFLVPPEAAGGGVAGTPDDKFNVWFKHR